MPDTAPRVPAAALLPWLELDDDALVERLPVLADALGDASDERESALRDYEISQSISNPKGWIVWNLGDTEHRGHWWCNSHAAAIAELARRVRELLGCQACPRWRPDLPYVSGPNCPDCHGRGWVVVPTT